MNDPVAKLSFSPFQSRSSVRVSMVRALDQATPQAATAHGDPIAGHLNWDRLTPFVESAKDALPRVQQKRSTSKVDWQIRSSEPDWSPSVSKKGQELLGEIDVASCHEWLFDVPGGQLCTLRTFDLEPCHPKHLILMLELLYYEKFEHSSESWENVLSIESEIDLTRIRESRMQQQRNPYHQLVFLQDPPDNFDALQRLIYRADLDADPKYCNIQFPDELNRRPGSGAALGPFMSVLWRNQDYIENFALLSAVSLVGVQGRLGITRAEALSSIQEIQDLEEESSDERIQHLQSDRTRRRNDRARLASMQSKIGEFQTDLAFGVEASASIFPLVPSLRVDTYHRGLHSALDLDGQSDRVSRMIERLSRAVEAESRAIDALESARSSSRSLVWTVTVTFVTLVLAPVSFVLAFFGASAEEVDAGKSLFDIQYWPVYAVAGIFVVAAGGVWASVYWLERRKLRKSFDQKFAE